MLRKRWQGNGIPPNLYVVEVGLGGNDHGAEKRRLIATRTIEQIILIKQLIGQESEHTIWKAGVNVVTANSAILAPVIVITIVPDGNIFETEAPTRLASG